MALNPSRMEQNSQIWQGDLFIRTKVNIPQRQPNWVSRPRLIERMDEGIRGPLTLVSAPAGYGKTALLSEWAATHREKNPAAKSSSNKNPIFAWISLDERDNDPARFSRYLAAALHDLNISPEESLPAHPGSGQNGLIALLVGLINQAASSLRDIIVVLDDYHLITSPEVHTALGFLLTHLPPQMHLVIDSRVDPPLQIAQLRARGQLVELRAADLRFLPEEVEAFLNQKMGLDLPREAIASLDAHIEGWIAGLQLAAIAIQSSLSIRNPAERSGLIKTFTGSHRYIVDYMAEQVLEQQPSEIQSFLLETSILDNFCGPLCDELLKEGSEQIGSQERMDYLEHANLFVLPLDEQRRWYRYHPLFAEFLRERLRQTQPERLPELHRRAAQWYERNGMLGAAVDHALAVGDAAQAVSLVEQIAEEIWMGGEVMRLLGWLEALPDEMILSRPRLCIFHAWILNILGDFEGVERRLQEAESCLKRQSGIDADERTLINGMLSATRAIIALMEGDVDRAVSFSNQALECLPADNLIWRSVVIRNLGNAYLFTGQTAKASLAFQEAFVFSQKAGNIYMALVSQYELAELQIIQGRLREAAYTLRESLRMATEKGAPGLMITGALHVGLSEVLREQNQLEEGIRHARAGIEYGFKGRSLGVRVCGYTRLGMLLQAWGDPGEAQRAFRKAYQLAPGVRRTSFPAHHDVQARLWARQGDLQAAVQFAQDMRLDPEGELSYYKEAAYLTLARILLVQQKVQEALRLLRRIRRAAEAGERTGRVIEALVLQALAQQALGLGSRALSTLERALCLAEPEGYVRVFVDEGAPMQDLLSRLKTIRPPRNRGYLHRLLAGFEGNVEQEEPVETEQLSATQAQKVGDAKALVEPLSDREVEVLRHIAAGRSNHEIAEKLVVAPSTVHWHVKNIYNKLNVHSRTQAILRARQLAVLG